jgi:hypothetical protein
LGFGQVCPYGRAGAQELFGKDIFFLFFAEIFIEIVNPYGKFTAFSRAIFILANYK